MRPRGESSFVSKSIVHVRRKKKDADPLRSAWHILEDWMEVNRERIVMISGIAAGALVLFGLAYYFLDYRTQSRLAAYSAAYDKYTATVGPAPATAGPTAPGASKVTYPDDQTKYTESAAAFESLANDYSDYRDIGHYYAGLSYLQIQPDKGIQMLQPLADGTSDIRAEATLALAEYYDKAGTYDQAEIYFQKIADNPGKLPRMYVLNRLASVKEHLNKQAEAAALYKTVIDVDRNAPTGLEAEKGLQRVDPKMAAALPPKTPTGNPSNTVRGNKPGAPITATPMQ